MLAEIDFPRDLSYSSDGERIPLEFYLSCLKRSKNFDLRLGYFSSNAIRVLSHGFAQFIHNGGKFRIITNHYLSDNDLNVIREPISNNDINYNYFNSLVNEDISGLQEVLSSGEQHFFDCLKYLLKENRIVIKPVKLKDGGMSHYKIGVFSDGVNEVFFSGSCNFTYSGLVENGENLEVKRSWGSESEVLRIKKEIKKINNIFTEIDTSHEYLSPDQVIAVIHSQGQDKDLEELLDTERRLNRYLLTSQNPIGDILRRECEEFEDWVLKASNEPRFAYGEPYEYQKQAYENWVENNYQGLFAMATGTGKTITALNCVLEEYKKLNYYRFIVFVPTTALAHQWQDEIQKTFNFQNVVNSSLHTDWESRLKRYLLSLKVGNNVSFGFVTTYHQLPRSKLKNLFIQYTDEFKSVTLISDEAHTLGSPGGIKNLPTLFENRIGLSATPQRKYDEYGSQVLEEFFNARPPKYTYYYSMKQAIEDGKLSEYEYHPVFVSLTDEEIEKYNVFTNRLRIYIDSKNGGYKDTPEAKKLLIQRKHVIHKAQNKLTAISQIIDDIGENNFRYAFVYVPEGFEPDYWQMENHSLQEEDERVINHYSRLLSNKGLVVRNFIGETSDRHQVLTDFEKGRYDALLAMKCLDEGVDVPRTEYAIFCASTGNPRQFIQRRGRVLRSHPNKKFSKIYDLIVAPNHEPTSTFDELTLNTERNIFKNELLRVINFMALANNVIDLATGEFEKKCMEYGIANLSQLINMEIKQYI